MRDARIQWPVIFSPPSTKQQLFPVDSCSLTARSKTRSQFATCHPLATCLLPLALLHGRRGTELQRVQTLCSRQWEGSIPDWMLAPLPPGSFQPGGFSSAISVLGPAPPRRAPHAARGASRERERQKGAERIETRR